MNLKNFLQYYENKFTEKGIEIREAYKKASIYFQKIKHLSKEEQDKDEKFQFLVKNYWIKRHELEAIVEEKRKHLKEKFNLF